jgi:hypothetical protein
VGSFSIDEFEFISLSRAIPRPTKGIVREVRAGVKGTTFWDTNSRGQPFTILSIVNAADVADAMNLFEQYQALKDDFAPVQVVWDDELLDPTRLMILNVDVIEHGLYATLLGIGGVADTPSFGMLKCRWDVEAVNISEED